MATERVNALITTIVNTGVLSASEASLIASLKYAEDLCGEDTPLVYRIKTAYEHAYRSEFSKVENSIMVERSNKGLVQSEEYHAEEDSIGVDMLAGFKELETLSKELHKLRVIGDAPSLPEKVINSVRRLMCGIEVEGIDLPTSVLTHKDSAEIYVRKSKFTSLLNLKTLELQMLLFTISGELPEHKFNRELAYKLSHAVGVDPNKPTRMSEFGEDGPNEVSS
jgi:hypothetical protein